MPSVRILPEILSNKIAAGEVVERPASVVKELLENAIDAGSDRITIDIDQGGRSMIRVSDNGYGMGHDDALLAIERYATSKITAESDLFDIRSLGFRGEALPSIAAVSRFTMITRDDKSDTATEIRVEGGKIRSVNPVGAPRGTMITVRQLFFNTPARRKFMKTVSTEFGHIADIVSCIALSRPEIRFHLTHNGKTVRQWHDVRNAYARVSDVMGENAGLFYPVSGNTEAALLSGWVCDPSATRSNAAKTYTFVNGRFIRDRGLQYAVMEGYRGHLMKGRFPLAVLYLTIPAPDVDVNVHPTKHEVRFSRQREVYATVSAAVSQSLFQKKNEKCPEPESKEGFTQRAFQVAETVPVFGAGEWQQQAFPADIPENKAAANSGKHENRLSNVPAAPEPRQAALFSQEALGTAAVIGQFNNTYILCEKGDELVLIDQHAAHERIIYEHLRSLARTEKAVPVQRLLLPETVELGFRESAALEQVLPELNRAGLEIDHFGANTFIIKAVPDILKDAQVPSLIAEIGETVDFSGHSQGIAPAIDACILLMACHGAIRANQALTRAQMQAIVEQLQACENPYTCPHGRPTMITWHADLLEKRFKRTS